MNEEIKIDRAPDIITITELKPKNYTRQLTENQYEIDGYKFEQENLKDKGSTRGVAMYIKKSLKFLKLEASQIIGINGNAPREVITIEIKLTENEKLLLSNVYRSPSSDVPENKNINNFLECFSQQKHENRVIMGDFNRKDINWETVTSLIEEDTDFIEAMRDGYLTHHI